MSNQYPRYYAEFSGSIQDKIYDDCVVKAVDANTVVIMSPHKSTSPFHSNFHLAIYQEIPISISANEFEWLYSKRKSSLIEVALILKKKNGSKYQEEKYATEGLEISLRGDSKINSLCRDYWSQSSIGRYVQSVTDIGNIFGLTAQSVGKLVARYSTARILACKCKDCGESPEVGTRSQRISFMSFENRSTYVCDRCQRERERVKKEKERAKELLIKRQLLSGCAVLFLRSKGKTINAFNINKYTALQERWPVRDRRKTYFWQDAVKNTARIYRGGVREQEICREYWIRNTSGRAFQYTVEDIARRYGVSSQEITDVVQKCSYIQVPGTICSCGKIFTAKSRRQYLKGTSAPYYRYDYGDFREPYVCEGCKATMQAKVLLDNHLVAIGSAVLAMEETGEEVSDANIKRYLGLQDFVPFKGKVAAKELPPPKTMTPQIPFCSRHDNHRAAAQLTS